MSKNGVAYQKKVEHAVRKLMNRWTGGAGVTRGNATTSRMRDRLVFILAGAVCVVWEFVLVQTYHA